MAPHPRQRPPMTWIALITKDLQVPLKTYNIKTPMTAASLAQLKILAEDFLAERNSRKQVEESTAASSQSYPNTPIEKKVIKSLFFQHRFDGYKMDRLQNYIYIYKKRSF